MADPANEPRPDPATEERYAAPEKRRGGLPPWLWIILAVVLVALLWYMLSGDGEDEIATEEPAVVTDVQTADETGESVPVETDIEVEE
ncbi:MAG: hypothetical protein ACFBQW_03630 [Sphingomonadaceae bacterium]